MPGANVRRRGAANPEPGKGLAHLETGPSPDANVRRRGAVNPEPRASLNTGNSTHRSSSRARHGNHCCGVVLAVTGSRGSN
jgi:hypothetical protein